MMAQTKGRFIVVEGLEGAGKSTAVKGLVMWLTQKKIPYIQTREPGGTQIGECLRSLIKNGLHEEKLFNQSELLLIYAARVQLIEQVIRPALEKGLWVVSDRFDLSTYAYQGGGRQISTKLIDQLSAFCLQGLKPDCLFFMDIMPEQGLSRVRDRGECDQIELESQAFFSRVYHAYQERVPLMSYAHRIDATLPKDEVQTRMIKELESLINE